MRLETKKDKEIRNEICELYKIDKEFKALKERKQKIYDELNVYLDKTGETELVTEYIDDDTLKEIELKVVRVMSKKIEYKIDRLENRIQKDTLNKFIDKTYTIRNWKSVVRLLKKYKVPAKEFIALINVDKKVNEKNLDQLEAIGEVSYDMLKDCYVLNYLSSSIRLFKLKKKS